jgi:hypothetical protein
MPYPLDKTGSPYSTDAIQLPEFYFDKLNQYAREHEAAVGWMRDQRRVCGAVKRHDGVSLGHGSFCISCSCAFRCICALRWVLKCTMAVSDADCGCSFDTGCAL